MALSEIRKSVREVSIGSLPRQAIADWRKAAKFTGPDDFLFWIGRTHRLTCTMRSRGTSSPLRPAWDSRPSPGTTFGIRSPRGGAGQASRPKRREPARAQLGADDPRDVYSHVDDRASETAIIEHYAWPESAVMQQIWNPEREPVAVAPIAEII